MVKQQDENGNWVEARPLPAQGWKAKVEDSLFRWGFPRLARLMAWWDERGLGK